MHAALFIGLMQAQLVFQSILLNPQDILINLNIILESVNICYKIAPALKGAFSAEKQYEIIHTSTSSFLFRVGKNG